MNKVKSIKNTNVINSFAKLRFPVFVLENSPCPRRPLSLLLVHCGGARKEVPGLGSSGFSKRDRSGQLSDEKGLLALWLNSR